jgi:hypothetical protein
MQEFDLAKQLGFKFRKSRGEIHARMNDCQNYDSAGSMIANQNMLLDPVKTQVRCIPTLLAEKRRILRESIQGG